MVKYNKLVRDYIPDIIIMNGGSCHVEVLGDEAYRTKLDEKLQEELNEFRQSHSLEELADLLEVLYAATKANGYTLEDLEAAREKKAKTKGAFNGRILLREATEK